VHSKLFETITRTLAAGVKSSELESRPMDARPDDARARLEGKRIAHGIVLVVAVTFVAASAAQIIPAVFGMQSRTFPPTPPGSPERVCSDGVRTLALALDRGEKQAWSLLGGNAAADSDAYDSLQTFRRALFPEWDAEPSVEQACSKSHEGVEAWAALLRLRRAAEQIVLRDVTELLPLRHDFAAHLPVDLR
jgi:hypothetical protein